MKAELTIWTGGALIMTALWAWWDWRAGIAFAGVWLILAGVGMVIERMQNANKPRS